MHMLYDYWTSEMPVMGIIARSVIVTMPVIAVHTITIVIIAAVEA